MATQSQNSYISVRITKKIHPRSLSANWKKKDLCRAQLASGIRQTLWSFPQQQHCITSQLEVRGWLKLVVQSHPSAQGGQTRLLVLSLWQQESILWRLSGAKQLKPGSTIREPILTQQYYVEPSGPAKTTSYRRTTNFGCLLVSG